MCYLYIDALMVIEGVAYGGLPFRGTGCPRTDIGDISYELIGVWDTVFARIYLPSMFLSTDYLCEKTDWTSYHGPSLYRIYIIY